MKRMFDALRAIGWWFPLAGILCSGCSMFDADFGSSPKYDNPATVDTNALIHDPLRVGDRVHIEFNANTPAPIPSFDGDIKSDGTVNLPLIGPVPADGHSPGELERDVEKKYVPAYYENLTVTVTAVERFFYVGGEVNGGSGGGSGGRIPYTGPITVTQAIQAAGGFNPFANRHTVELRRYNGKIYKIDCLKALRHPELDLPVYPNDSITVYRRFY